MELCPAEQIRKVRLAIVYLFMSFSDHYQTVMADAKQRVSEGGWVGYGHCSPPTLGLGYYFPWKLAVLCILVVWQLECCGLWLCKSSVIQDYYSTGFS